VLHRVCKANRESEGPAPRARKLVGIGDNYSGNRNYTNLYFISEMVAWGWYDEVELLFGPVGHTHNGIDSQHSIHNKQLLSQPHYQLADILKAFTVWTPSTRPGHCVLEGTHDWVSHYKGLSFPLFPFLLKVAWYFLLQLGHNNPIVGMNARDPITESLTTFGFRIARTQENKYFYMVIDFILFLEHCTMQDSLLVHSRSHARKNCLAWWGQQ
jgi:hypothetical protein